MKKFLIAGFVVIVALAGIVFFTLSNLGPLVKKTVNTFGPEITKTRVEVADVSISIFSGNAEIKDFVLGNPKGFKSPQAMKVGSIYVDIDESTITKDPIVINRIEIDAPEITYEKISGSDNFRTLLKNVQGSAKNRKTEEKAAPEKTGQDQQGRKIIIKDFIIKDGKVKLAMAALGGKQITAPLPDIHLKNIGEKEQGATPAEAFEQVFSSLYTSISADSVTNVLNAGLKKLGKLKELGGAGLEAGSESAKKAAESASKTLGSAGDKLKNLFKKD